MPQPLSSNSLVKNFVRFLNLINDILLQEKMCADNGHGYAAIHRKVRVVDKDELKGCEGVGATYILFHKFDHL